MTNRTQELKQNEHHFWASSRTQKHKTRRDRTRWDRGMRTRHREQRTGHGCAMCETCSQTGTMYNTQLSSSSLPQLLTQIIFNLYHPWRVIRLSDCLLKALKSIQIVWLASVLTKNSCRPNWSLMTRASREYFFTFGPKNMKNIQHRKKIEAGETDEIEVKATRNRSRRSTTKQQFQRSNRSAKKDQSDKCASLHLGNDNYPNKQKRMGKFYDAYLHYDDSEYSKHWHTCLRMLNL